MRDRSHDEAMSVQLNSDPAYAAELLADVLRNGSPAELVILLRQLGCKNTEYQQDKETKWADLSKLSSALLLIPEFFLI